MVLYDHPGKEHDGTKGCILRKNRRRKCAAGMRTSFNFGVAWRMVREKFCVGY